MKQKKSQENRIQGSKQIKYCRMYNEVQVFKIYYIGLYFT